LLSDTQQYTRFLALSTDWFTFYNEGLVEQFANEASAKLDGAINNSTTSIVVTSTVRTPASGTFRVRIDSEYLKVTAVSGSTWTVTRGDGGTTAASHLDQADIFVVVTKEAVDALVTVQASGTEVSNRRILNLVGAKVADNSGSSRVDITVNSAEDVWTKPVSGDFSWANQGSATVTASGEGLYLFAPTGGGNNMRCLEINAPSSPYEWVGRADYNLIGANYIAGGFHFRDSSGGKALLYSFGQSKHTVYRYNSTTAWNSTVREVTNDGVMKWVKIYDDGTYLSFYLSANGRNWIQLYYETRSAHIGGAPNKIGWYVDVNNGTYDAGMHLLSWKQV
jgi:hypothetical protein